MNVHIRAPSKRVKIAMGTVIVLVIMVTIIAVSVAFSKKSSSGSSTNPSSSPTTAATSTTPVPGPTATTDCGDVKGLSTRAENGEIVEEFINIPYAVPPTGDMRWKPSILLDENTGTCWNGTLAVDNPSKKVLCTQYRTGAKKIIGEENCLVLSVRTAKKTDELTGELLPVLVWIHGGGLYTGYGEATGYSADVDFTASMDAVTVNINYRLGMPGFLTLEELWNDTVGHESYGNYGFTDQINALKWVKKNIGAFGGDANRVMLLGESAGATSILALVASPLADGLFQTVWAQSPAPEFRTDYQQQAAINRNLTSVAYGCHHSSAQAIRECLYNMTVNDIIDIARAPKTGVNYFKFPNMSQPLQETVGAAVVDPFVLPRAPRNVNFERKTNVTLLVSNLAQETEFRLLNPTEPRNLTWSEMDRALRQHIDQYNTTTYNTSLFHVYPNESIAESTDWLWETIVTDIRSTCPTNRLASSLSSKKGYLLYRLYMENRPSTPLGPLNLAFHTWDTNALFGFKLVRAFQPDDHDLAYERQLKSICRKFLHTGAPSDGAWKSYPGTAAITRNQATDSLQVVSDIQGAQCEMWKENGFAELGWQN